MTQVIGKAALEIVADASPLEAGLAKAEGSVKALEKTASTSGEKTSGSFKGVGDAAEGASRRIEASGRRLLAQLERESSQIGKTRSEWLAYRAQQLGVSDAAGPMLDKMRAAEQSLAKTGVSAAQTAAALRMVPAQFTDIATSLLGGQNALLVLTQQGGQLKDMFGGIGPAARAIGSYIAGLVNPFSLAAAAAALLGAAAYKGSQETNAFNQSLILTGNYAGKSADQLSSMAARISQSVGTQGAAAEVLNKLAATGKIAGDQIELIGAAAVAMNQATGAAVDDTIKTFVELGQEPSKAIAKLNEQYHFLTDATYQHIRALEEEGKTDEAAAAAQKAYAEALRTRAAEVKQNLGFMERAWHGVTGAAKSAWDAMLGLGRAATLDDIKSKIAAVQGQIADVEAGNGFASNGNGAAFGAGARARAAQLSRLREDLQKLREQAKPLEDASVKAAADAERQKGEDEKISARDRLAAQAKATRSRADQRKDEIDQLKRDAQTVGMAADEYNKRLAAIEERYKDPKGPKARAAKAYQDDAATKMLQNLRDQGASTRAALASADKLTGAEKQRAEFLQQIADLKDKKILTADQKSLLANQDAIKAQLDQNVESEKALRLKEEIAKVEERSKQVNEQIANQQASRREGYARELDAFGLGANAQKQVEAFKAITREYEQMQWQLEKATKPEARGSKEYLQAQADIRAGLQSSLQDYADYYAALQQKQGDWRAGFTAAFADYRDAAANVATQVGSAFGNAFQGMEDAAVGMVLRTKVSFGSLVESMIADIVRLQVRAASSGLLQALTPAIGGLLGMSIGGTYGASTQAGLDNLVGQVGAANGMDMSGLAGARADGGPVNAGSSYLVGERGMEIFKPNTSGTIIPNHALGGGNVSITVENNAGAQVTPQVSEGPNGERFVRLIIDQAKREMAGDVASGQGMMSKALGSRYGLTPRFR